MEELKKIEVYECPVCHGQGTIIGDWDAYNQCGPVGLSSTLLKEKIRLMRRAIVECGRCKGKGVLFLSEEPK